MRDRLEAVLDKLQQAGVDVSANRQDLQSLSNPLRIVVVGEFSSGKSTLINALSATDACATGTKPVTMEIKEVECDGFTLVDTMGINTPDFPEHKIETFREIHKADAVLMVLKAISPFTDGEEEICKELGTFEPPVVVAVTYVDALKTKRARADCQERVAQKMQEVFGGEAADKVFYLDAADAEAKILDGETYDDQHFEALKSYIVGQLADKGFIKLGNALAKASKAAEDGIGDVDRTLLEAREEHRSWLDSLSLQEEQIKKDHEPLIDMLRESVGAKEAAYDRACKEAAEKTEQMKPRLDELVADLELAREREQRAQDKLGAWQRVCGGTGAAFGGMAGAATSVTPLALAAKVAGPVAGAAAGYACGAFADVLTANKAELKAAEAARGDLEARLHVAQKEKAETERQSEANSEARGQEMLNELNRLLEHEVAYTEAKFSLGKDKSDRAAKMCAEEEAGVAKMVALCNIVEEIRSLRT